MHRVLKPLGRPRCRPGLEDNIERKCTERESTNWAQLHQGKA
jgi:hypothetical protein